MTYRPVILAMLILGNGQALAGQERRHSLDEAVSDARDRYPGRVLSAETRRQNGRDMHNIRILTRDGRVRRYRIDADAERQRGRPQRRRFER